ncbi:basic proline-rich protein-like [Equus quagga]|uniref:basic proline-rich protein-like n=1 Tax=Equus quagga TaxID=89248 RepID=UPI001EE209C0|nr:basic proline-rich protein-like [Equus quagga]
MSEETKQQNICSARVGAPQPIPEPPLREPGGLPSPSAPPTPLLPSPPPILQALLPAAPRLQPVPEPPPLTCVSSPARPAAALSLRPGRLPSPGPAGPGPPAARPAGPPLIVASPGAGPATSGCALLSSSPPHAASPPTRRNTTPQQLAPGPPPATPPNSLQRSASQLHFQPGTALPAALGTGTRAPPGLEPRAPSRAAPPQAGREPGSGTSRPKLPEHPKTHKPLRLPLPGPPAPGLPPRKRSNTPRAKEPRGDATASSAARSLRRGGGAARAAGPRPAEQKNGARPQLSRSPRPLQHPPRARGAKQTGLRGPAQRHIVRSRGSYLARRARPGEDRLAGGRAGRGAEPGGDPGRRGPRPAASGSPAAEGAREAARRLGASSCSAAAASSQTACARRLLGLGQHFPAVSRTPLRHGGLGQARAHPLAARSLRKSNNSGIREEGVAGQEPDRGAQTWESPRSGGRGGRAGARPAPCVRRSPSARRAPTCGPSSHCWAPGRGGAAAAAPRQPGGEDSGSGSGAVQGRGAPRTAAAGTGPPTIPRNAPLRRPCARAGGRGGERKGTLTSSSSSAGGGGGPAAARGLARPGSAGGAAAGLSRRLRRRGTRAHGRGTRPGGGLRWLAPLPSRPVRSPSPHPHRPGAPHPDPPPTAPTFKPSFQPPPP